MVYGLGFWVQSFATKRARFFENQSLLSLKPHPKSPSAKQLGTWVLVLVFVLAARPKS